MTIGETMKQDDTLELPSCPKCSTPSRAATPHFAFGRRTIQYTLISGCDRGCECFGDGPGWMPVTDKPVSMFTEQPATTDEEHHLAKVKLAKWWRERVRPFDTF